MRLPPTTVVLSTRDIREYSTRREQQRHLHQGHVQERVDQRSRRRRIFGDFNNQRFSSRALEDRLGRSRSRLEVQSPEIDDDDTRAEPGNDESVVSSPFQQDHSPEESSIDDGFDSLNEDVELNDRERKSSSSSSINESDRLEIATIRARLQGIENDHPLEDAPEFRESEDLSLPPAIANRMDGDVDGALPPYTEIAEDSLSFGKLANQ